MSLPSWLKNNNNKTFAPLPAIFHNRTPDLSDRKKREEKARGWGRMGEVGARVCVREKVAPRTHGMVHERMNVNVNTWTDVS